MIKISIILGLSITAYLFSISAIDSTLENYKIKKFFKKRND